MKCLNVFRVIFGSMGLITAIQIACAPASAALSKPQESVLEGVWELESFNFKDKSGKITPWCEGSHGVIIYTGDYMSTAVNCTSDASKVLLYSGPFRIQGQTVYHHAQNYSNPSLNKVFSRAFHMKDENHLELNGDLSEGTVTVTWARRTKTDCSIKSRINPELEQELNRTILCSSVIEKLVEKNIFDGRGGQLLLTVTNQEMYAVHLKFKFTKDSQNALGSGTLHWNPDGSEFVIKEQ